MKRMWVVFYLDGKEIWAYSYADTFHGELKATIGLLAYEKGVPESAITWDIVER